MSSTSPPPPPWLQERLTLSDTEVAAYNKAVEQSTQDLNALRAYDAQQRRIIYLNETAKDRMRMQNEMLWAVFVVIACSALFAAVHGILPDFFPHSIYTVVELSVIGGGALYVYFKYREYTRRDAVRFDQIQLSPPPGTGEANEKSEEIAMARRKAQAAVKGDVSASVALKQCVGAACCGSPDDTENKLKYDAVKGKCVAK